MARGTNLVLLLLLGEVRNKMECLVTLIKFAITKECC